MWQNGDRAVRPAPARRRPRAVFAAALVVLGCAPDRAPERASDRGPGAAPPAAATAGQAADGEVALGEAPAGGAGLDSAPSAPCPGGNDGLTLPAGFCATVFTDDADGARHMAVAPNGDVFVALRMRRSRGDTRPVPAGGILALRDTNGDGRADRSERFGTLGGTGIGLHAGYLYADETGAIVRYPLPAGALRPSGRPDTVVAGLPTGGHSAHNFVIDRAGFLFVNFGSRTNSCQQADRQLGSKGVDPCIELDERAGIWRFRADRLRQRPTVDTRYATGIRNAVAMAIDPSDGGLYAAQHGRDQLAQNWPASYTVEESAELPAEVLLRLNRGDDFGWPYCYFDGRREALVLAPEYGGTGTLTRRCTGRKGPVAHFPAHWAPNALLFYTGAQFPARYRNGAFIAFHGSWNRAPAPQGGYNVVFVPLRRGRAAGRWEVFAEGFARGERSPTAAVHRPTGLAVTPDGALLVSDDKGGRIWRITYGG